jgi:hypothetical protein
MRIAFLLIFLGFIVSCKHEAATKKLNSFSKKDSLSVLFPGFEEAAQKWFDSVKANSFDSWTHDNFRVIQPNTDRYDSLASATGLPKRLFVYLDALYMPYTVDIAKRRSNSLKTLLLKLDHHGSNNSFVGWGIDETLDHFAVFNGGHIHKFILNDDRSLEALTVTFSGADRSDYIKTMAFTCCEGETTLEKQIESYLGQYSFVPVVRIVDTTAYIEILKGQNESLSPADKYRLAALSPIVITGIMREKAKTIKQLEYISSSYNSKNGVALPPIMDTALIVPTGPWIL